MAAFWAFHSSRRPSGPTAENDDAANPNIFFSFCQKHLILVDLFWLHKTNEMVKLERRVGYGLMQ